MKTFRSAALFAAMVLFGSATSVLAQTRIITGRVSDSVTHDAVSSGQVSVQGTTVGSSIKDDGTFTLAVPNRDVTLSIRSIGFKRADVTVPAAQSSVEVALARDYFQLEAIVVTGQATGVERKNLANAVSSISSEKLVAAPTNTIEQAMAGKLAGATIAQNGYAPGGGMMVRLRGVTSIIGNASPLYVIDGVIASDAATPPGTNPITLASIDGSIATTQEFPVNRIADINPNEIENIEVLKGASASAIYGSKASAGVVLITTKRGRVGRPQFNITQRFGTSSLYERHRTRQFNSLADATSATSGFGALAATYWQPGAFYDHDLELADHHPLSYETAGSVQGGTEDTRYYLSGTVKHDGGVIRRTYGDKQSLHMNLDQQVGSRFSFGAGAEVARTATDRGLTGNDNDGTSYYYTFPYTPSFFDLRPTCGGARTLALKCADGSAPIYPNNPFYSSNPIQTSALLSNEEIVWRSILSGKADLDVVKTAQHNVRLSGVGGLDFYTQHNNVFSPNELQFEPNDGLAGTSVQSYTQNVNSNIAGHLVYQFKPNSAAFSSTLSTGLQYERRYLNTDRTLAQNLIGGLPVVSAATSVGVNETREIVRDFSTFVQEEFLTLHDRLLVTAGLTADQSSNNGDPKKLSYYPKGSASYRFTNLVPGILDELKFRAAAGESGNLPKWQQKRLLMNTVNIAGVPSFQLQTRAGDPTVKPERQLEVEGGVDATLLKGRANLEFTVYKRRISDLLLSQALQPSQGFTSRIFNGGIMSTKGLETSLTLIPLQKQALTWTVHTDFSLDRCTIDSIPVPSFATGGVQIEKGKPCRQVTGRDTLNSVGDSIRAASPANRIGRAVGASVNPMILGDGTPRYSTNLSNDLKFKAFDLYFLWFYQKGGFINDRTLVEYDLGNNTPDFGDACTASNCAAGETLGQWRVRMNRTKTSRVYTQDDSFFKLREVTLRFDLPNAWVHKVWSGARFARLGLAGRNLITITNCTCDEPEQGNVATIYGAASNAWKYPSTRSFWISLDLGF